MVQVQNYVKPDHIEIPRLCNVEQCTAAKMQEVTLSARDDKKLLASHMTICSAASSSQKMKPTLFLCTLEFSISKTRRLLDCKFVTLC